MEKQEFPERHYTPGGELIKPYDITSWSLPLHRHVKSFEVNTRMQELEQHITRISSDFSMAVPVPDDAVAVVLPVNSNESFRTAFAAVQREIPVQRISEKGQLDGNEVAAGSFLLSLKGRKGSEARKLVGSLKFPVIPLQVEPDLKTQEVKMPRIALVETYFHDMDAGWTRFVFDTYHIPYKKIRPHELEKADLQKNFDIVIFPDEDKNILMEGKYKSGENYYQGNYHPDYTKGLGKKGKLELLKFMDQGGKIISWGQSTALFEGTLKLGEDEDDEKAEEFMLPFKDVSEDLKKEGLYIPGSLVKINLLENHPLTMGMPAETGVFSRGRPVFTTSPPGFDMDRRVIATYPEKEILMSGYAAEEEKMGKKSCMNWMKLQVAVQRIAAAIDDVSVGFFEETESTKICNGIRFRILIGRSPICYL